MIICVAGKNDIASNVLALCVNTFGKNSVLAVANRDDTGKHTWQKSLTKTAEDLGIKVVTLTEVYDITDLIFLSVEFDKIIKVEKFASKYLYNIHFSLLPKYKGVYTAIWPLLNFETETGVTLHLIEDGIDTGPIIDQNSFIIDVNDNARDIYFNCLKLGYELIDKNLEDIINGKVNFKRQSSTDSTYYSKKSINFNDLNVDLNQTAHQIHNYLRAFSFQEYQLPKVYDFIIKSSVISNEISQKKPGTIIENNGNYLVLSTIDYNIFLYKDYSKYLFKAVEKNNLFDVKNILVNEINLSTINNVGWSCLMIAAYNNFFDVAKELIKNGADINQVNRNGTSILMYAKDGFLNTDDDKLFIYLLEKGANPYDKDSSGKSLVDYCVNNKNEKVLSLINNFYR